MSAYKICLIGEAKTGKTNFINFLLTNDKRESNYVPTLGVEVHPLREFGTTFTIWDCAGDPRFMGLFEGYYIGATGCLIFATSTTLNTIPEWEKKIKEVIPDIPIVVVITTHLSLEEEESLSKYTWYRIKSRVKDLRPLEALIEKM